MLRITSGVLNSLAGALSPPCRGLERNYPEMILMRLPRASVLRIGTAAIVSAEDDLARGCRIRRHDIPDRGPSTRKRGPASAWRPTGTGDGASGQPAIGADVLTLLPCAFTMWPCGSSSLTPLLTPD